MPATQARHPARTYRDLCRARPIRERFGLAARRVAIELLARTRRQTSKPGRIWIPYYHHVLDDERAGLDRHLRYFRGIGEFIGLDDAAEVLRRGETLDGNYFCITFDDGFRNCLTNALPILQDHRCPAAFFLCTDYMGTAIDRDWDLLAPFWARSRGFRLPLEFLTWAECRELAAAGMAIGSHTCSHVPLKGLSAEALRRELAESKERIERELGVPCRHFACPWGQPGTDFLPTEHAAAVRDARYDSLLTTRRGANFAGASLWDLRRIGFRAGDSTACLRYYLSREDR